MWGRVVDGREVTVFYCVLELREVRCGVAVAALLYMVCEELLVSAHEEGDDHVWWVDIQV